MRVSQHFGLTGTQGTFDFIDVDVDRDTPLFIDPAVLAHVNSPWAAACTSAVQSFFQEVLDRIIAGDGPGARALMSFLGEDNSTHLGFSSSSRGSGLGSGLAEKFYQELSTSRAVASGLISDIEDTALMIEGIREDRISDVTTNVIRRQLVEYTQRTAAYYGIPLQANVVVGPFWNGFTKQWEQNPVDLPVTPHGPLLLVPKSVVRKTLFYNPSEYYRHYVLEYLRNQEFAARSPLVYLLKSGRPKVNKGDVEVKYRAKHDARPDNPGVEKRINVDGTEQNPGLLNKFKEDKEANPPVPLSHESVAEATATLGPDFDALLAAVSGLPGGTDHATAYERAVEALLSALLYPHLANPIRQERIHAGRKRIDITYTNTASEGGFFYWLAMHYPAANIVVECKNYTRPIGNEEYDQLSGRFSPSRGKYGLLIYRQYADKDKVMSSCRDAAQDDHGFMTALDDDDLKALVNEAKAGDCTAIGGLLHRRFNELVK